MSPLEILLIILGLVWIVLAIILCWKFGDWLEDFNDRYVWEDYDF